jgi:hypothetical protein
MPPLPAEMQVEPVVIGAAVVAVAIGALTTALLRTTRLIAAFIVERISKIIIKCILIFSLLNISVWGF